MKAKFRFGLLLLGVIFVSVLGKNHKCGHSKIVGKYKSESVRIPGVRDFTPEELSAHFRLDGNYRNLQAAAGYHPIKIHWDFSNLAAVDAGKRSFLMNDLMPNIARFFASFIQVKNSGENLKLKEGQCIDVPIQSAYVNSGIDADLIVFVSATEEQSDLIAWAAVCQFGQQFGNRPIAGQLNFIAKELTTDIYSYSSMITTAIHELFHIIVFSPDHFKHYIDQDGRPYGEENVRKTVTVRGVQTEIVTLPKLVNWARSYFSCSTVEGIELENEGGSASKGSHWERRNFMNEMLTSSLTDSPALSELTLLLLESSGWYLVDKTIAAKITWGQSAGCEFLNKQWILHDSRKGRLQLELHK
eukprot:TRINITY_DN4285_c0_g1_i3.p1 TRINITY_DN4285_c0_g1~~TRINITY_DN4285_c0_g1_i3.p1  ORF type:complete len:358 (+),score=69.93 TRINITY_DN4285_c0_g1_i3:125-1198(+)